MGNRRQVAMLLLVTPTALPTSRGFSQLWMGSRPLALTPRATTPIPPLRSPEVAGTITSQSRVTRSEEHTSELQSLTRTSYAVFCLKKKITTTNHLQQTNYKSL